MAEIPVRKEWNEASLSELREWIWSMIQRDPFFMACILVRYDDINSTTTGKESLDLFYAQQELIRRIGQLNAKELLQLEEDIKALEKDNKYGSLGFTHIDFIKQLMKAIGHRQRVLSEEGKAQALQEEIKKTIEKLRLHSQN